MTMTVTMTFFHVLLQIGTVAGMVVAATTQIAAAARDDKKNARTRLLQTWFWSMPPVALWLARDFAAHQQSDALLGLAAFLVAWVLLYPLAARGHRVVAGLVPLLFLTGIGVALQADFGAFSRQRWALEQIGGALMIGTAIAGGLWLGAHRPTVLRRLFEPRNLRFVVWICLMGPAAFYLPHLKSQAWALNLIAFAILLSIVAGRVAGSPVVPVGALDFWKHWRPALMVAALPGVGSLFSGGDMAPAILMTCALGVVFGVLRQPRAALVLMAISLLGAGAVTKTRFPSSRPMQRLSEFRSPARAASSQTLLALHAVARGGLIGQGVAQWTTARNQSASTLRQRAATSSKPVRALSKVPLATTDAIFAALASATGVLGFCSALASLMALTLWLLRQALDAFDLRARAWFGAVATLWAASGVFTAGWPVNAIPIAGISAPTLAGGISNALCWAVLLGISAAWATDNRASIGRLAVYPEWLELPARNRTLRPLLVIFGIPFLLIGAADVRHGYVQREATLTTQFMGLRSEQRAREAIIRGWVQPNKGAKVTINEAALSNDVRRLKVPSQSDIDDLRRWVANGLFIVKEEAVEIRPRAFIETDRLGALLALAQPETTNDQGDKNK